MLQRIMGQNDIVIGNFFQLPLDILEQCAACPPLFPFDTQGKRLPLCLRPCFPENGCALAGGYLCVKGNGGKGSRWPAQRTASLVQVNLMACWWSPPSVSLAAVFSTAREQPPLWSSTVYKVVTWHMRLSRQSGAPGCSPSFFLLSKSYFIDDFSVAIRISFK